MFSSVAQWIRRVAVRHPFLADALLASLLAGPAAMAAFDHAGHPQAPPLTGAVGVAAGAFLAVTVRRLWPLPVLFATAAATVVYTATTRYQPPTLLFPLVITIYTVASRIDRRRMWRIATGIAVPLYLVSLFTSRDDWWAPQNLGVLAWIGMATAVGDATGSRRAYVAEVEERARRAEQTREDEARRRVVEERIRIARELHDVISHHIAVINVQAGAARHVLRQQPAAAGDALEHIRHASDTVLRELGSIVGVLRQADDLENSTEPVPGLARLGRLLDTVAAAGLRVDHHRDGDERDLPAMVDLAAYRIVQEALTNAHKHGAGAARLTIAYTPEEVVLEVTNPIGNAASGGGHGLIGMRERATATGGTLVAQRRPGNLFQVSAVLPTSPPTKPKGRP
ncbi:sensor histidine kinase [Actinoplanes regularis]|uniref:histidine kinase n=1 Tax=Actinoplanes regularis TaxID=52697 RepID=A0A239JRM5_9ACTN|nr:histidine kinase [Actinoplanes regularis]GIE92174.1 two-component sensor histidine kinase [Actinoplanes regularis]SNT08172.1 Histidine kinase [Actinoplanes regularis]